MPPSFNQNKCVDFGFQSCISNFLLKQKIYGGNIFNFNNRAVFIHKKNELYLKTNLVQFSRFFVDLQ